MSCERLNVKNPRSFLEISMRNLGRVNDAGIWKPEIGRHNTDVSNNANIFLHLFQKNALCIINTFFQHRHLHKMQRIIASTLIDWFLHTFGWRLLIGVGRLCENELKRKCRPVTTWWSAIYVLEKQPGLQTLNEQVVIL